MTATRRFNVDNNGLAVNVNTTAGAQSFNGGYITGGTGHAFDSLFGRDGGGVYLDGGSFTLNGGTILGNTTGNDNGGGVEIYSGTMTMNGGTICYNKIGIGLRAGSSQYNRGGGATTANFVMNDGVIANNKTRGILHDWWCYGDDYATFYGGSVINNGDWGISAKYLTIAGGVTVSGNANGVTFASTTATISGSPVISGNTGANLKLNNNKTLNINDSLSGANIGITMQTPGVFTSSTDTSLNDASKFTSDNTSYAVVKNADNQLELVPGYIVTYKVVNGTWSDGTTADKTETVASGSTPARVPTGMKASEGYTDGAWDTDPAETTITEAKTFTYTFNAKTAQTIAAEDVNVTYGDTDKSVSASVTDPATGGGAISYAVKDGSGDYIDVNTSSGALMIKKVPTDGKAYVIVTAAETDNCVKATKEVAVTINKAEVTAPAIESKTYNEKKQTADVEDGDLYTVTSNEGGTDVGSYDVVLTLTDADNYKWTDSDEADKTLTFKITQADSPDVEIPTPAAVTYDPAKTLESVTLPDGWAWADKTIVPSVNNNGYEAEYAVPDYKNYDYSRVDGYDEKTHKVTRTVSLTVNKAESTAATVSANSRTYDSTEKSLVNADESTLAGGAMRYTLGTNGTTAPTSGWSTSIPAATDAGTYYVWYKVAGDSNHNSTEAEPLKVTISKLSVTMTSASASKAYDGTALTKDKVTVSEDGFADGEGAEYKVTGKQTLPGSSKNTFTYTLKKGTKADNYKITKTEGTLTITDRTNEGDDRKYNITVEAKSDSFKYDGKKHSVSGFKTSTFTENGVRYTVGGLTAEASAKDAGTYRVKVTGKVTVKDSKGNDLTDQFAVTKKDGELTISKANATCKAPTARKVVYNGKAQDLVTTGTASGGKMQYSSDGNTYTAKIPTGTDAGKYTVYYRVEADKNHNDLKQKSIAVTIEKTEVIRTAPSAKALTYNGEKQKLVTEGKAYGGIIEYSLDGKTFDKAVPEATDAGNYTVYYRGMATENQNHKDSKQKSIAVTIKKAEVKITAPKANSLRYSGEQQKLVTEGKAEGGVIEYSLDGETFNKDVPEAAEAGDYTVYYRAKGDENHEDSEILSVSVSIMPVTDNVLSDKSYESFSGHEEFVLGAGDNNLSVSAKGCEGMDVQFELKASGDGYVLVTRMDNYGRNAEFDLSFDKKGGSVAADVTCEEYNSKYSK